MPYPFLFGTYSLLRAITNAPANMAMTKEIIPAAAIDRATIPFQRMLFPPAGCTG